MLGALDFYCGARVECEGHGVLCFVSDSELFGGCAALHHEEGEDHRNHNCVHSELVEPEIERMMNKIKSIPWVTFCPLWLCIGE